MLPDRATRNEFAREGELFVRRDRFSQKIDCLGDED